MILARVDSLRRLMHDAGPYLAVELLLPGGSVIAGLMWLYKRRRRAALAVQPLKGMPALVGAASRAISHKVQDVMLPVEPQKALNR